jgi:hypothetical protein
MQEPIRFTVHITQKDLVRLGFYNTSRRLIIMVLFAVTVCYLLFNLYSFATGSLSPNSGIVPILLAITLYWVALVPLLIYFRSSRMYKANRARLEEVEYTFSEEKFATRTRISSSEYLWENIARVKETKSWLLLYPSPFSVHIIPKKDIPAETLNTLRALLAQKTRFKG